MSGDYDRGPGFAMAFLLGVLAAAVLWVIALVVLTVTGDLTDGLFGIVQVCDDCREATR